MERSFDLGAARGRPTGSTIALAATLGAGGGDLKVLPLGTAAALASLLLHGCSSISDTSEKPKPFQFRSLTLRQNDASGNPAWELQSPKTRYQIDNRVAKILQPSAILFSDGKPSYRITAPNGLLIRDGEQIELNDGVRMESLDDRGIEITGRRAIWRPDDETLDLIGSPKAVNKSQQLKSDEARYLIGREVLQLRSNLELQQWNEKQHRRGPANLTATSPKADWSLKTGVLAVAGPVKGRQRADQDKTRLLSASAIEGNTAQNWLDFLAPVTIKEKTDNLSITAGRSRWWTKDDRLSSSESATGTFKQLTVKCSQFELLQSKNVLKISKDCELIQPEQTLQAQRCRWNWDSGDVLAQGDVELRRKQYNQITRAQQLTGVTGDDGQITFTAPDQQVETQLEMGQPSPIDGSSSPEQRPAPPPVQF